MQCMQINKYEHEHDGGSKKKTKHRLITTSWSHKMVTFFIFSKKGIKTKRNGLPPGKCFI
jgi:ribosomal protein L2